MKAYNSFRFMLGVNRLVLWISILNVKIFQYRAILGGGGVDIVYQIVRIGKMKTFYFSVSRTAYRKRNFSEQNIAIFIKNALKT